MYEATFTDAENGVTSMVYRATDGFRVLLRDDDAGEILDHVITYQRLDTAIAQARKLVQS